MAYISFLAVLFLLLITNLSNKQSNKVFRVIYIFFCFLLFIRFGQGTDYFNYKRIFVTIPPKYSKFYVKCYLYGVEPFYYIINVFAKKIQLGFPLVICISAFITMYFFYKTINKYSSDKLLSFFILFTNYFFYLHTAVRQGIAISITTYAIFEYINNHKYKNFLLYCFLAMMFHTSAIICMMLPFFMFCGKLIHINTWRSFFIISFICIFTGIFLFRIVILIAGMILPRYAAYKTSAASLFSIFPILIRYITSVIALYLYNIYKRKLTKCDESILILYLVGNCLFFMLASSDQASRLTDYFTIIEIIYFARIYSVSRLKIQSLGIFFIILLFVSLFIKDLVAFQNQGLYISKSPLAYPYISLFNKDRILFYRGDIKNMERSFILNDLPENY